MKIFKESGIPGLRIIPAMLLGIALIFSAPVNAQNADQEEEEKQFAYSDEELLAFFDVNQEISTLQTETQQRIAETVEAYDLTMERFNQIAQAAQIGALQGGIFSDEEINAFNELGPQVNAIQREMQQSLFSLITEYGMTTDSYQEILSDYRSDAELQAHVRELLRERARQQIREARQREAEEAAEEENAEEQAN